MDLLESCYTVGRAVLWRRNDRQFLAMEPGANLTVRGYQMTVTGWYSPNTSRMAPQISPRVA
jgi:hypothetical protein